MANPYLESGDLANLPSGAGGVTVAPSGTAAVYGSWVEITASAAADYILKDVHADRVASGSFLGHVWIQIGVGSAGNEVPICTTVGKGANNFSAGTDEFPVFIPIDLIPAGSRIAVRMAVNTTSTANWFVSISLIKKAFAGNFVSTQQAQKATGLFTVAGNGTIWANSTWATALDPTSADTYVAGFVWARPQNGQEIELDLGVGAASSELVVSTTAWDTTNEFWESGPSLIEVFPLHGPILTGNRIAVRERRSTTNTANSTYVMIYFENLEAAAVSTWCTNDAMTPLPALQNYYTVPDYSLTTIGAWGELIASTANDMLIVGYLCETYPVNSQIELATGPASSETFLTTLAVAWPFAKQTHRLYPPVFVPAGTRLSARCLTDNITGSPFVKLIVIENPTYTGMRAEDAVYNFPYRGPATTFEEITITNAGAAWTNSALTQIISRRTTWDSGTSYVRGDYVDYNGKNYWCHLAHSNQTPPATGSTAYWGEMPDFNFTGSGWALTGYSADYISGHTEFELDILFGEAGFETLAYTIRDVLSVQSDRPYRFPMRIPADTRVTARVRSSSATTNIWQFRFSTYAGDLFIPPPPPTSDFSRERWWRGTQRVIGRIKFFGVDSVGADETVTWSGHTLRGDADDGLTPEYEGRVMSFGFYERQLSGIYGDVPVDSVRVNLSDTDNALRSRLGVAAQLALLNTEVEVALITEEDWKAGIAWLVIFRGIVSGYTMTPDKTFQFEFKSYMANRLQQPTPLVELTPTLEPTLPPESIGKYAPLLYGNLSRQTSNVAPPSILEDANGTHFYSGWNMYRAGQAETASTANPVTGVTVTAVAGGSLSLEVFEQRYGAVVTAVDAGGVETRTEKRVLWYDNESSRGGLQDLNTVAWDTVSAGNQTIRVAWTASTGAVLYRVYLCYYYYGMIFTQRIEVSHPTVTVDFDAGPAWVSGAGQQETVDNISTGADLDIFDSQGGSSSPSYLVTAIMADGETQPSDAVVTRRAPHADFVARFDWAPVASALGYAVYKTTGVSREQQLANVYQRFVTTNTYFEDDGATAWMSVDGLYESTPKVPAIPFGQFTALDASVWYGFLVCYGAASAINRLTLDGSDIADSTTNWTWPGKTDFATYFGTTPYRTYGNLRLTVVYGRGTDAAAAFVGEKALILDAVGYEAIGNATGAAITDAVDQLGHFLDNLVLRPVPHTDVGGNWLGTPTWSDAASTPKRDAVAFAQAKADMAATIFTTTGGWYLAEPTVIGDVLKRLLQSCDCAFGWNLNGQAILALLPPSPSGKLPEDVVDWINDIDQSSFQIHDDPTDWANVVPYKYDLNFSSGEYQSEAEKEDASLQAQYRQRKVAPTIEMWAQPSAFAAGLIAQRALYRTRKPPRSIFYARALPAILLDLAARYTLTHPDGAAAAGYVEQFAQVKRMVLDVDAQMVSTESWDLDWIETITPNWLVEIIMAEMDFGGLRDGSPYLDNSASQTALPVEWRQRAVPWTILPESAKVSVEIQVKVGDANLTLTPYIYNVTDAATVLVEDVDGNADPLDPTTSTTYGTQTRYLPIPADGLDKVYELRATVAGGDTVADPNRTIGLFGKIILSLE